MQFTISATTFLALVSSVLAQTKDFDAITVPTDGQVLQAGEVCVITWEPTSTVGADTITIRLMQGADEGSLDFNPIDVASNISNSLGFYSWKVDSSLVGYATYGLKIELDTDNSIFQYSFPFQIEGDKTSSSAAATVPSTSSLSSTSVSVSSSSSVPTTTSSDSAAVTTATTSSAAGSGTLVPTVGSGNSSITASTAGSTTLTTATKPSSTGSATASTTPIQTAGAGKIAAGTFAAIGGVVAAVLAL